MSIRRWDEKKALYGLTRREPTLNLDELFKNMYHSVDISHLHSIDIENNFKPLESAKFVVPLQIRKQIRKRSEPKSNDDPPKRRRRSRKMKPKVEQGQSMPKKKKRDHHPAPNTHALEQGQ
jgi:hypothetical protein